MEKKKVFTRYNFVVALAIVFFSSILIKLIDIQIVKGEDYRRQAQDKSIRIVEDDAPRGKILDRNSIELATNVQSYTVFMMKPQSKQEKKNLIGTIEKLVDILNKNNEKIKDDFCIIIKKDKNNKPAFEFDFPNNYEDENKRKEYIEKAAKKWKKDKGIDEKLSAEETFRYLQKHYEIYPTKEEHKFNSDGSENIEFIRQMMVIRQMIEDRGYMAYKPVEIAYVSRTTAFEIMEKSLYLPGVDVKIKPLRTYPYGDMASLTIGSLKKVGEKDMELYKDKLYDVNQDLVGRDGIEKYAEDYLRGEKGGRTVRVDANGRVAEELSIRDPVPGDNVVLTIDQGLQQATERYLDDTMAKLRKGEIGKKAYPNATRAAAVVIDVHTGEILTLASRPGGYDPNIMAATGGFTEEVRKKLLPLNEEHPDVDKERILKPMFNYATQSSVPPGSTFKMITAIAGLETGAITPDTPIYCGGHYTGVPNFHGNCWIYNYYGGHHGNLDVVGALKNSCNVFFFETGRRVTLENIAKYAKMFGLSDDPTGIEIAENPGNVANREMVKQKAVNYSFYSVIKDISSPNYDPKIGTFTPTDEQKDLIFNMIDNNDRDYDKLKSAGISSSKIRARIVDGVRNASYEYNNKGLPLNAAIGQGEDHFTPLQMANYIATIANGGTKYRPHLVKKVVKPDGTIEKEVKPEVLSKADLKPTTLPLVIKGMDAVTGEGGTAGAVFRNMKVKTAGKTGTAEASGGRDDYSWFAGFAPEKDPQIAVAVVIHEGGGYGSSNVARDIYEYYFGLNKPEQQK